MESNNTARLRKEMNRKLKVAQTIDHLEEIKKQATSHINDGHLLAIQEDVGQIDVAIDSLKEALD